MPHFVAIAFPVWGHTRPLCVLSSRLAAARPDVVVTLLMAPSWMKQAQAEIATQLGPGEGASERLRLVSLFDSDAFRLKDLMGPFAESYPSVYRALCQGDAPTCATTKRTFDKAPPPSAVLIDFFALTQLHQTRAISGTSIPIFAFISCNAAAIIRLYAPESMGGLGDFGAKTDAEALRTGKSATEIGDQIFKFTDGSIVRLPGLPPMYDHEFFAQNLPFEMPMAPMVRAGYTMLMQSSGVFIGTCSAYDGEALLALNDWVTSTLNKPLYAVGPLLRIPPTDRREISSISPVTAATDPRDIAIQTFLDKCLAEYGERSIILISFGTIFWPTVPDYLDELVDALIDAKFPFIFSHASPFASVPPELRAKVESCSSLGMLTSWCPQQYILSHPATGWFMTHGGHGSVFESLVNGIPLICWPFEGDQPTAAATLTHSLDCAFHLVQVRTGSKGLLPLLDGRTPVGTRDAVGTELRSVFEECRGETGRRKRANAGRLQCEFAATWEESGDAKRELESFLEKYGGEEVVVEFAS
ncbi:hypothetical protein FB45DRAFT_1059434 [Roridomyces roridus]|uniref:Glycosyltransferase family 1 protein n=1 Tax=Roridomyces roridus TaxID=1738132 RepID=A0AAD7BRZ9_9AGAR|nr:hypothetical protein FB45DRAFT_1059434 [Roridomyces roridus]